MLCLFRLRLLLCDQRVLGRDAVQGGARVVERNRRVSKRLCRVGCRRRPEELFRFARDTAGPGACGDEARGRAVASFAWSVEAGPQLAQAHAEQEFPVEVVGVDAGAEQHKCNVARGDLDPFVVRNLPVHRHVDDGVELDGVVDRGPRVRVLCDQGDDDGDVDGISEIDDADGHAEDEQPDEARGSRVLSSNQAVEFLPIAVQAVYEQNCKHVLASPTEQFPRPARKTRLTSMRQSPWQWGTT